MGVSDELISFSQNFEMSKYYSSLTLFLGIICRGDSLGRTPKAILPITLLTAFSISFVWKNHINIYSSN